MQDDCCKLDRTNPGSEMAGTQTHPDELAASAETQNSTWAWHPPLPLRDPPVFVWPPRPLAMLRFLLSLGFLWSLLVPFFAIATVSWLYLQPALDRCVELRADWVLQMYARNMALMLLVAGGLHLYFFTLKRQRSERQFDNRALSTNEGRFFTRDQVWDNMFWTCASGVTLWTAYEVFFMWSYANEQLAFFLDWRTHPIWFVMLFFLIPFWHALHFYFTHRLLHWKPLFRIAHQLHHKNDNIGPWSGLSMHPIEHVIYLSSVLIHVVVLSHPIHIFFHMLWLTLGAVTSHTGFEGFTSKGKPVFFLGSFQHQLHHRFYDCNLGSPYMPWDEWLGTNHDGTEASITEIRKRRRAKQEIANPGR